MHYGCRNNPFDEKRKVMNGHKSTGIYLRQIEEEKYEDCRKNYLPFDYSKAIRDNVVMKTKLDEEYRSLKEVNRLLLALKTRRVKGRNESKLKVHKTSVCNPVVIEECLSSVQAKKANIKHQLDTLLARQKEIAEEMSTKETDKMGYRKLMEEQSTIEKKRKELMGEFKKLLSVKLKAPEEQLEEVRRTANTRRAIKSARRNLKNSIKSCDKELEAILNQRKVTSNAQQIGKCQQYIQIPQRSRIKLSS
eukprot:TRINITY_DN9485_c0_g2_i11.p1 TRINITY_DN9485_c0_g2~~TRINITY_DN9485_c0_g2_i11.p1  ORF type:complete len:249 (-),score=52.82 TRINITY_DN9485_c0_g2_i11:29-775(-)